ncbi:MAG: YdbL family protein [Brevundimonas sp.]|uniref:YdbL family protein n=1 Tax=Brevundimonas sp. TaxID=1871086 RepID=UPI002733C7DD|nr:YdbL family protein [Brevundimonas sp.]MDP3403708.1 YdbL family protein [Brevundimonas sp.]
MEKILTMSLRKLFVIGAAILALGVAASGVLAQTAEQRGQIVAAKTQGIVGEQADGYLGFRTPTADPALQQAVTDTNAARREVYAASAREVGTTTEVAAARMFESQLLPRMTAGQWYRNAAGQWVQR